MIDVVHALDSSEGRPRPMLRARLASLLGALGLLAAGCSVGSTPASGESQNGSVVAPPAIVTVQAAAVGVAAPSESPWGRSELCNAYCSCMGSGKCTDRNPSNCLSTCMSSAGNWNIPCRIEKCKSANKDYADQIGGSCATSVGIQGCWDKSKLAGG
jgi:hypothetical protein